MIFTIDSNQNTRRYSIKKEATSAQTDTPSTAYVIDPLRFRRDKFYFGFLLVFWLFWFPLTCFATAALFLGGPVAFLLIWLSLAWYGAIAIPVSIAKRNRKQVLTISGDCLLISGTKLFSKKKVRFHRYDLSALTLEHYTDIDMESVYTLNMIQKPGVQPGRLMLAPYVHPDDKAILLDEIAAFLDANGISIQIKNDLASQEETNP